MEMMRLKAVYNAAGESDFMGREYLENFFRENIRSGESGLMEICRKNKHTILVSILVFEDLWSRNIYALKNWEIYEGFPDLISLLN